MKIRAGAEAEAAREITAEAFTSEHEPQQACTPSAWPELLARWLRWQQTVPELLEAGLRRLVAGELSTRPEQIRELTHELLRRWPRSDEEPLVLTLHPQDAPLLAGSELPPTVRIAQDETLDRGGCTLESERDGSRLDARLETRLARLLAALNG